MVETLLHFALPFAVFSFFRRPKEALILSLVALLPDLDIVLGIHRFFTHSLLVILASCTIGLIAIKLVRPKHLGLGILAMLAVMSHLFLDLFEGYMPILWPFVNRSFWIEVSWRMHLSSIGLSFDAEVLMRETQLAPFEKAYIFTSEGFAISAILITAALVAQLKGVRMKVPRYTLYISPRSRQIGFLMFTASVAGLVVYWWFLFFTPWTLLTQIISFYAMAAVLGIFAWIGFKMATTQRRKSPTPLPPTGHISTDEAAKVEAREKLDEA